jgi:hypothetical protein
MQAPQQRAPVVAEQWYLHNEPLATTPGMHRFEWRLNWDATGGPEPDLPDAGGGAGATPIGPRAVPGRYRVVLNVDGADLERTLEVVMDPRSPATQETLQAQLDLSQEIYSAYLEASKVSAEVTAMLRKLSQVQQDSTLDPRLKQQALAAQVALEAIAAATGPAVRPDMGLQQAQAALRADMASVRTGDRGPTVQEADLYSMAAASARLRIDEWDRFKRERVPPLETVLQRVGATMEK